MLEDRCTRRPDLDLSKHAPLVRRRALSTMQRTATIARESAGNIGGGEGRELAATSDRPRYHRCRSRSPYHSIPNSRPPSRAVLSDASGIGSQEHELRWVMLYALAADAHPMLESAGPE